MWMVNFQKNIQHAVSIDINSSERYYVLRVLQYGMPSIPLFAAF